MQICRDFIFNEALLCQNCINLRFQQVAAFDCLLVLHDLPDYDAPLSEAGEYTPKYHLLRDLLPQFNSKVVRQGL